MRNHTKEKLNQNQGFSLIELLISITILVIIFIPLMGNFIQSMRVNMKAEKLQIQSNLAASILEGLKGLKLSETIIQFTGPLGDFSILTDENRLANAEDLMVLRRNASTGMYEEVLPSEYASLTGQDTYYFAINGIKEGGLTYDSLIKINSGTYKPVHSNILNNYPMPEAINLDDMANGLFFSNGEADTDTIDQEALATYLQMGEAHALSLFGKSDAYQNYLRQYSEWLSKCEEAQIEAKPTPAPPSEVTFHPAEYPEYCDEVMIKSRITKTMRFVINQSGVNNTIEYQIIYNCNWPSESNLERQLSYPVGTKSYSKQVENIYLFFRASIFTGLSDYVELQNAMPAKAINFYVAKQAGAALLPKLTVRKTSTDLIQTYTNLDALYVAVEEDGVLLSGGTNQGIVKTEPEDRLYEVTVGIYEHVDSEQLSEKFKKELFTLTSTKEE